MKRSGNFELCVIVKEIEAVLPGREGIVEYLKSYIVYSSLYIVFSPSRG